MANETIGQQGLSSGIWDDEAKALGVGGNFFKMEEGVAYEITFLDEGVKKLDKIVDKKTGQTKDITKRVFRVKVVGGKGITYKGEEKTWDVPYGTTEKSLFGKLVELFQLRKTAVGMVLHVAKDINADGKTEYKVLEWNALDNQRLFNK